MIKNKDGSYNKISIILLTLIGIIGIGLIISTFVQNFTVDIDPLHILGGIVTIIVMYACYNFISSKRNKIKSIPITSSKPEIIISPVVYKIPEEKTYVEQTPVKSININKPLPDIKNNVTDDTTHIGSGIIGLIIGVCGVMLSLFIMMTIMNSLVNSMPQLPEGSAFNTAQTNLMSNMSGVFNLIGMAFMIIPAFVIISVFFGITSGRN